MESDNRVCVFSSVCVLLVGGKVRSGGGHGVPALPVVVTSAAAPAQAVTEEEIMQGWREVAETNCTMDVYAMPDGVSPSFSWHKRGTFGEWARLDLGGFSFPFGTNDEAGGMLYVSVQNIRKLVRVDGDTIAFPYAAFIPPHGGMSFSIDYGAEMYSDSQGDITVMASLTPVNSGETDPIKTNAVPERQTFIITPNGTLTVVKAGFFVSRGTNTQTRLERVQQ